MLLLGKSHGQMSLVGYSPWGCKESDTTEVKQASKQITCSCWVARYSNSFLFDLILSYFILLNSGKEQPASAGDTGDTRSIPGLVRSPAGRHGNPLQFSCLKNPMNRGAWRVTVERCYFLTTIDYKLCNIQEKDYRIKHITVNCKMLR